MTLPGVRLLVRWSLDFVSDKPERRPPLPHPVRGGRVSQLAQRLAAVVDTSLGGVRVVRELEAADDRNEHCRRRVVSDNGTELTSGACCAGQPE